MGALESGHTNTSNSSGDNSTMCSTAIANSSVPDDENRGLYASHDYPQLRVVLTHPIGRSILRV